MPCDLANSLYNTIEYGRVEEERTPRQFPVQPSGTTYTCTTHCSALAFEMIKVIFSISSSHPVSQSVSQSQF